MKVELTKPMFQISELMTKDIRFVKPDTLLSEIDRIFKTYHFHHLPVIDESGQAVGIISTSDYYKLQNHFSIFNNKDAEERNQRFFKSLIAEEVMAPNPIAVTIETEMEEVLGLFLANKFHALIVENEGKCIGIITPYDIIEQIYNQIKNN